MAFRKKALRDPIAPHVGPRGAILGGWSRNMQPAVNLLGGLFARPHTHGKDWTPPATFSSRVFEHFLSRDEPDVLFHEPQLEAYTRRDLEQLQRLHARVESNYANLDRRDLRVIHCDLWHDNVKLYRGVLYPFDFEDTIRGFRLHDIAMAMLDLLEVAGNDRYPSLLESFRRGYEEYLEWPDGEMEILQVGRLLWKINYVARFERKHFIPF